MFVKSYAVNRSRSKGATVHRLLKTQVFQGATVHRSMVQECTKNGAAVHH
jgi:hypothetical protein